MTVRTGSYAKIKFPPTIGHDPIFSIDGHDFWRREAMDCGQHRCSDQTAVAQGHEVVVAVNEVEFGGVLEGLRDVKIFGHLGIGGGVFFIALVDNGVELGARDRVPGCKQSYIPAACDQAFGNISGHGFPGAVLPGRCSPGYRRQNRHFFIAFDHAACRRWIPPRGLRLIWRECHISVAGSIRWLGAKGKAIVLPPDRLAETCVDLARARRAGPDARASAGT